MTDQQGHSAAAFRCAYCNYDLSGTRIGDNCPECGKLVNFRNVPMYKSNGAAVASLVLGIVSIVMCLAYGVISVICGPLAIYFSSKAKQAIQAGNADPNSQGMATAGRVCGIIGTCLGSVYFIFIIAIVALTMLGVIASGP